MTLIATIAAIALVAVGIGYAYTASTANQGNSATTEYITLVQGSGSGDYKFANDAKVEWNTVDIKTATEFSIDGQAEGASADHMDGFYIKQIGQSFTIKAKEEGIATPGAITCTIGLSGTWATYDGDHDTTFFLKVVNDGGTTWFKYDGSTAFKKYGSSAWDGASTFSIPYNSEKNYKDTTVTVYYGIDGEKITIEHSAGAHPATGPTAQPLNAAALTFTVNN